MENNIFSPMEIDAIGEIMNISLGSSATAVSTMLDQRVDITTPRVNIMDPNDFTLGDIDPAVGVEIRYVSGLEGSNIMLLKRSDVKTIVDILMGSETSEEEFELNELTISAVCEVMNQMMGAASTALSDFLGKLVNISTPRSFEVDNFEQFKTEHFAPTPGKVVVVRFTLSIEGHMRSEFINVISVELARELIAGFGLDDVEPEPPNASASSAPLNQEEIERLMAGTSPVAAPAPPELDPFSDTRGSKLSQDEIERLIQSSSTEFSKPEKTEVSPQPPFPAPPVNPQQNLVSPEAGQAYPGYPAMPGVYPQPYGTPMPGYYPPPAGYYPPPEYSRATPDPKVINTQPMNLQPIDPAMQLPEDHAQNLDLIMSVPLEVSVEIGRAQRKVQDIIAFSKGSLVVLDKLAGDQVDLFVNGHCIAKGDVVVIDDNFGIRITEILKPPSPNELLSTR
jgi:flagellar motor switch protein FliN/FliY